MNRFQHGGDLHSFSRRSGRAAKDILDFSANMNPMGPPPWLRELIAGEIDALKHYPDPHCRGLKQAASQCLGVPEEEILCGNGSSELLYAALRALQPKRAVIPVPAYVDYRRACEACGVSVIALPLLEKSGFAVDFSLLEAELRPGDLLIMGQANNPTGRSFPAQELRDLARAKPDTFFLIDEAFADFVPGLDRLTVLRPPNVLVLHSLTKFYAVPGLRLGLAYAASELRAMIEAQLPDWSVNHLAQAVGRRALQDATYAQRSLEEVPKLRRVLQSGLQKLPDVQVFPGEANFLLCRLQRSDMDAADLAAKLLQQGIAIRSCYNFEGLGAATKQYFRLAVRDAEDNERLLAALADVLGNSPARPKKAKRTPAIMVLGTCSNAGKSIIATALCRMLKQDGYRVAPFKSQNMSLNSYVTLDGKEMGRAQVTQAAACHLEPDVRMNPILLKPGSDTGSQVIVMGKAVGNMSVKEYLGYKPEAFRIAKQAYDELADEYDVIIMEGAGSPAEINLKRHDIVNTAMARHAGAKCLLVGDIDRGGVFASFVGTMELLEDWERSMIKAYVINKFRGDPSLLQEALDRTQERTAVPFLGVIPHIHDLGIADEDSVSFKLSACSAPSPSDKLDIAVIDLPFISNADDVDPLRNEPDVHLRIVRNSHELGVPDCIIIPGSKNTISDLKHLRDTGLYNAAVKAHTAGAFLFGICAGYQMLGLRITDPHSIESKHASLAGFGLLAVETTLSPDKTLHRTKAVFVPDSIALEGYEIHHGLTRAMGVDEPAFVKDNGEVLGLQSADHSVLGTYLHGVFANSDFRRRFVDMLQKRVHRTLSQEKNTGSNAGDPIDRLCSVFRVHSDQALLRSFLSS
jgi:cobyric acid synthase CobQ/L-threonine-O-3-phosphate decarboxylase